MTNFSESHLFAIPAVFQRPVRPPLGLAFLTEALLAASLSVGREPGSRSAIHTVAPPESPPPRVSPLPTAPDLRGGRAGWIR